jgi:hypothetical protein
MQTEGRRAEGDTVRYRRHCAVRWPALVACPARS